jgi:hypothetical protein
MAPHASLLVKLGIPALALLALTLIALGIARFAGGRRVAIGFALGAGAWLAFTGVLAASGYLARADLTPPPLVLIIVPTLFLPLALAWSRLGARLAEHTPLAWLIGFHAFRVPLELVMHRAAVEGTMPPQMTFTGMNFDIISGAGAVIVAVVVASDRAPRWLLLAWNALGSLLLFAIIAIAVLSLPRFHAFGAHPAVLNTWIAYFPYVWLPAGLVTSALFGHALLWRRLAVAPRGALAITPAAP